MNPGTYDNLSNEQYHAGPGESKSLLDLVRRSAAHYAARKENDTERAPTAAQIMGTAFHSLLLEPETFGELYAIAPKVDRRTKEGKATWEAFQAEHGGKQLLDEETFDKLTSMQDAVHAHPAARALLTGSPGVAERSVYWRDPVTGLLCRCRPDWWRDDGIIVDVKTTEDASPEEFARSIAKYRYHVQHAFYLDGVNTMRDQAATGMNAAKAFIFLAVEKSARVVNGVALGVAVYVLDNESVALGRIEYQQDLERIAECTRTGIWPGYGDKIQSLSLPQWKLAKNADLLSNAI